jgi:hypothetical protein
MSFLSSLINPLAIVTIVGPHRTAKSTLKLPTGSHPSHTESVFKAGMASQSVSKGLNILAKPVTLLCGKTNR